MGIMLLDIGNVLVRFDFMSFCRKVSRNGETGAQTIRSRFCAGERKELLDTGRFPPQEYLELIAADPLTLEMPIEQLRLAWQDIFEVMPGSKEAVAVLRQHHELWIMSDTEPLHFAFLIDRFPLLREMDRFFLSFEHGHLKHSPEAFYSVLATSGRQASEFMLIDDRQINIDSAARAGVAGILFRNWAEVLASPALATFFHHSIVKGGL
jgi:FMN phosphatase YigB (HAD superfamily)